MKSRILFAAGFMIAIAFPVTATPTQKIPSVDEIEKYLEQNGGKTTLNRYFSCQNGTGYEAIVRGGRKGAELDLEMGKYSDACVSESLGDALGLEMQRTPSAVLSVFVSRKNPELPCLPFISADLTETRQLAIMRRTIKALKTVHDPALQDAKGKCLVEVTSLISHVTRSN